MRISGIRQVKVATFIQRGSTRAISSVPITTPTGRPSTIGSIRRHTAGTARRFTNTTHAFSTTSTSTSAGLSTRAVKKRSATGR